MLDQFAKYLVDVVKNVDNYVLCIYLKVKTKMQRDHKTLTHGKWYKIFVLRLLRSTSNNALLVALNLWSMQHNNNNY